MAEIVCVIGSKGGTGKTTISHMLGQGLGLLGHRAAVLLTDSERSLLSRTHRRYLTADARTAEDMRAMARKLEGLRGWIGVIDGGANRTDRDMKLYRFAHLVLLPFRDSPEDIRTVILDLDRYPTALAVPAQWPSNPWQREAAERLVAEMLEPYRDRILEPVPAISSSKLLLREELPPELPSALNNACRAIAWQVLDRLGLRHGATEPQTQRA